MNRVIVTMLLATMLVGCHLPTLPERPTPTSSAYQPVITQTDAQVVWIWLPQTKQTDVFNYRLAVDQNLASLPKQQDLLERSKTAQNLLEKTIKDNGGLYNTATGQPNRAGFIAAINSVNAYIAAEMPNITDIIYVDIQHQTVKVHDGIASWDNVRQKVIDTNGSVRYTTAVSLELHYVFSGDKKATERLGLDMQPAPIGAHNRYEFILKHILQPYL